MTDPSSETMEEARAFVAEHFEPGQPAHLLVAAAMHAAKQQARDRALEKVLSVTPNSSDDKTETPHGANYDEGVDDYEMAIRALKSSPQQAVKPEGKGA